MKTYSWYHSDLGNHIHVNRNLQISNYYLIKFNICLLLKEFPIILIRRILKNTREIEILKEALASFNFFFTEEDLFEESLEYVLANINKLVILMMTILTSYNSYLMPFEKKESPKGAWRETLFEQIDDNLDFIGSADKMIQLGSTTISILKESIRIMIKFSPLMTEFLDQNCPTWRKQLEVS